MADLRLHRIFWSFIPPTAILSLLSLLGYLSFRLYCLLSAQQVYNAQSGSPVADGTQSTVAAWFFFALELFVLFPNGLPYLLCAFALRPQTRPKTDLSSTDYPTVDILITCCNEDLDVVLNTITAACVLDYPRERYRVFACDDGHCDDLEAAVLAICGTFDNLFYTRRIKSVVKDYKAGNLNHGLKYSRLMNHRGDDGAPISWACRADTPTSSTHSNDCIIGNGRLKLEADNASEYIAGLDADMIPEPHWLKTIMPYITGNPNMALACPPQTFYDIPENDLLTQTMEHFAWITEAINAALGHADCLGSGYVMRRSAIESIGGFPTESLAEDVCCSTTLLAAGWETCFVPKVLQHGSVPDSFVAHIKQRTRWFVGHIQTALLFNFRLWGSRCGRLKPLQRLVGLVWDLRLLLQVYNALNFITIPFALLSGSSLVIWTDKEQLKWLIRLVSIWTLCSWMHQGVLGLVAGLGGACYDIRMPSYDKESEQWMAPYIFAAFFRSFVLPRRLGGAQSGFTPSGSIHCNLHERDLKARAPFWRRVYVLAIRNWVIIHILFVCACLAGAGLTLARSLTSDDLPGLYRKLSLDTISDKLTYLITRIGWPPLIWLQYTTSSMNPIIYMLSPPATLSRDSLLERDSRTGAAYPRPEARRQTWKQGTAWRYVRPSATIVYTAVLLVLSCWL